MFASFFSKTLRAIATLPELAYNSNVLLNQYSLLEQKIELLFFRSVRFI